MTARIRRLTADWEQIKRDYSGHRYIFVEPIEGDPPEKYRVTYLVNGIYLLPDGRIQTLGRHVVEISLHAEYPRYKPLCRILTPIWHPNFKDGQICIGDIWGAGESLSDIIVNIGDMIQYKSWNSYSPLSSEAAAWAMQNRHIFPVGTVDLFGAQPNEQAEAEPVIDLLDETPSGGGAAEAAGVTPAQAGPEFPVTGGPVWPAATVTPPEAAPVVPPVYAATQQAAPPPVYTPPPWAPPVYTPPVRPNDFDITYEELAGVTFTPAAQRMQGAQSRLQKGGRVNFKTIFMKGLLYGLIGGIVGWGIIELLGILDPSKVLGWMGYTLTGLENGYVNGVISYSQAYAIEFAATCIMSALFCGLLGGFIGAAMGAGEGIYYGSVERAVKYGLIGLGIALGIGLVGGYLAEILYMRLIGNATSATPEAYIAFARAIVWSVMGLGVGLAVGLIKPGRVRILCCLIGGFAGGFIGGFLFEFIAPVLSTGANDTGMLGRAIGITLMGLLIGLGIGLLEQFAKGAWLKVVRGEFEGKEYIVFAGVTSIGNNSRNTIVLFKDKLVAPSHCEIVLEGASYVLVDKGSPLGTIVNGMRVGRHTLRPGDAIAIGNSVLVFNTR